MFIFCRSKLAKHEGHIMSFPSLYYSSTISSIVILHHPNNKNRDGIQ